MIRFTRVRTKRPTRLAKEVNLREDGTLDKTTVAHLSEGVAMVEEVLDMAAFADALAAVRPEEALMTGVPTKDRMAARIVTRRALAKIDPPPDDVVARTRDDFVDPFGPGIMLLDIDPPKDGPAPSRDEIVELLSSVSSVLARATMVWRPSSSSYIARRGGELIDGLRGQHIYLGLDDATRVSEVEAALEAMLWAAGHGEVLVSAAGSRLLRCPVDTAVWSPERLIFEAGMVCHPPLEQRHREPVIINPEGGSSPPPT